MVLYFATSNRHKFSEADKILARYGIEIKHFPFEYREIRSDSIDEVAMDAVNAAYKKIKKPVFVEDSGLFIDSLNGFPGTYSAWVLKKIGNEGILKLMQNETRRTAEFKCCVAYRNGNVVRLFRGKCKGTIAKNISGNSGFGYDPIFIPSGYSATFAEKIELKTKLSHRYKALKALANYINSVSLTSK
jgi:XTP/dITP diphosphohydrolase